MRAKIIATENDGLHIVSKACKCLYTAYKAMGKYDKALTNHEEFLVVNETIFNEKNIKQQTQQEMQYEFNKTSELKNAEILAKGKESRLYFILSVIGFLFAAFLGFFFYKNRKKNRLLAKQKILLEASIDEKNVLLKETHHRVKNSFQIVSSLLYLQSENMQDKEAQIAIREAQNRVRSMVLIHQKLYNKDQLIGIDTQEYIHDLTRDIFESHQFTKIPIQYSLEVEPMVLDIETITPIGLILNELITNVLKHAFKEITENCKMHISFTKIEEELVLKVKDNGKGMSAEIRESSFGIQLMKALAKKLKASLDFTSGSDIGTLATLNIKRFTVL